MADNSTQEFGIKNIQHEAANIANEEIANKPGGTALLSGELGETVLSGNEERVKLRAENIRDQLTGLYNRQHLDLVINEKIERNEKSNIPFALLMLDIDFFKKVNDTYGHENGSSVLKQFARLLSTHLRTIRPNLDNEDVVVRYGGEEFAVILPNTVAKDAFLVSEKLRSAVSEHKFTIIEEDGNVENIQKTVSIGVAEYSKGDSEESLIKRSDKALYEAKNGGRNQVVMANQTNV